MRVQTWAVQPSFWPRGRKLRVVMMADIHAGWPNMSEARLAQAVDLANAQGGDLIALMGDYRATHPWQIKKVPIEVSAPILAGLKAPLGVFAVLGNHDWRDDDTAMRALKGPIRTQTVLEAAGIPVLANRAVKLGDGAGVFWLLGLDSQSGLQTLRGHRRDWRGMADLPGTLAQMSDDAPAILLAHEPDILPQVPERVALTLSGHTHGGQLRLPALGPATTNCDLERSRARGLSPLTAGSPRWLHVSAGLGSSPYVPVRLCCRPEATLLTLVAADA